MSQILRWDEVFDKGAFDLYFFITTIKSKGRTKGKIKLLWKCQFVKLKMDFHWTNWLKKWFFAGL